MPFAMSKDSFIKRNLSGAKIIGTVVVVVIAFIIGVDAYIFKQIGNTKNESATSREDSQTGSSLQESLPANLLTIEQVKALATQEASNNPVASIELEKEDSVHLYKVSLADGQTIFFNAETGAKVKDTPATEAPAAAVLPDNLPKNIDFKKVQEIAQAKNPHAVIRKIEVEQQGDITVFSVQFKDGSRLDINATDGSIIRTEAAKDKSAKAKND